MTTPDDSRARIDELIAAADRVAHTPLPPQRPKWLPAVALGAMGVVAVIIGLQLASGDDGESVAPGPTSAVPIAVTTIAPSTTQPVIITLPPTVPPTSVPATAPPTAPPTTETVTSTTVTNGAEAPVRWITFESNVAHLEGSVPEQATADRLSAIAAAVVGADHVDAQYLIDPTVALPPSEPVFFPDRFKFAPNSSELTADDIATLDLVMVFMVQNPQATMDIVAYTDSAGPDGSNLELSQTRANTIWAYLLYNGIAPERVTATGMGEAKPIAPNDTEEGRAQNRRVEFVVHDLLG
jgi:outer membrane protein OmpA-like peptidoglycan-associated protein